MNNRHTLTLLLCLTLLLVAGCEQTSIAEQEQIKTRQTLEATTPSATPAPSSTPAPSATTGPSPTATTAPTATATPQPTATPLPPTPTPNPALAGFSLCSQQAGDAAGGRFSAQIAGITTTVQAQFERVTIGLKVPDDSAPPHAQASCLLAADDALALPGAAAYSLQVRLSGWLHDQAFAATTISPTQALSGTTLLKSVDLRPDSSTSAGATLAFGLAQPLAYRLTLEKDPYRLVLDIARSGAPGAGSDPLAVPGAGRAQPDEPLFYIQNGDVWAYADGQASNLTKDRRKGQFGDASALAVSPATQQIAFCAVAPGADIGDRVAPRTLWLAGFDGEDLQALALQNLACDQPAFAPDGKTIAYTVDETGAIPARLSIWTVGVGSGAEQRATAASDEWSRFAPQWLANGRLVYAAQAEDGRSTLFVREADGRERDIGADLLRGSSYVALGRPMPAPDGRTIAVEALRAQGGADLLLIDPNGAALPRQSPIGGSYWVRPLAWAGDGTLYYLTSACESTVAQSYALRSRTLASGDDRLLMTGITLGGFGEVRALGAGLAYVTYQQAPPGPRGPLAADPASPSALWFWDVAGNGTRARLAEASSAISQLAP